MSNSVLDLFARCEFSLGETVQITDNTRIQGYGLIDNTLAYIQQNPSTYVFSIVWVNLVTGQSKTETLDAGVFPAETIFSPMLGNNNGVIQFYLWNAVKPTLMTITQKGYSYEAISGASSNWLSGSTNWSNGVMTVFGSDYYAFNGKTFTQLNPLGGYINHEYLGSGWFYVINQDGNACYLYNMNTKEVLDIPSGGSSPVFTGSFIDSNGNIIFGDEANAYSFNPQTLQIKIIPNGSSFSSILIGTTLSLGVRFGGAVQAQLYYQGQMYYNDLNNQSFTLFGPGSYIFSNRSLFVVYNVGTGIAVTPYTFGLPFGNEKLLRNVRNFTPSGHYWPRHSGRFRV